MKSLQHSTVIPVYNSQACLSELYSRIVNTYEMMGVTFEIVFVNDSSTDDSWAVITELAKKDRRVRGVCFRKNFGQDNAILAGLNVCLGEFVTIMDDDLQHDPCYIPDLATEIKKGFDVVYACYNQKKQRLWKNAGSWFNGRIAEIVINKPRDVYLSPYKMLTGSLCKIVCEYQGPYPYVDGLLFRATNHYSHININHESRFMGTSSYTFMKSVKVWSYLATNFSILPLRIATAIGLACSATGFLMAAYFVVKRIMYPISAMPLGWASLIVSVLILGGTQLFAIGIVGEYVGRTFLNINRHPQYTIRETTWPNRAPAELS